MTLQVGDTVRVKAPGDDTGGWRDSVVWVGTVHDTGRRGPETFTVTFGENAKRGFWTYPACGLERVESDAPTAAEADDEILIMPPIWSRPATLHITGVHDGKPSPIGFDDDRDPLTVHLDAALASLRRALAAAATDGGSVDRLVALVGLLGHVERCVRELPE